MNDSSDLARDPPRSRLANLKAHRNLSVGRIVCSVLFALVVDARLRAGWASAQVIQPVSASREIYAYAYANCVPPKELRHSSTSPTEAFDDTVHVLVQCDWPFYETSESVAEQHSHILDNAIDLRYDVFCTFGLSNPWDANAISDASITFRIPEGRRVVLSASPTLEVMQAGNGVARVSLELTGPNGLVDSLSAQSGPGSTTHHTHRATWWRILDSGNYTIDAHAQVENGASVVGRLNVVFTFSDVTAVVPSTWARVKSLYRS